MITDYQAKYFAHDLTLRRGGNDVDVLSRSLFDSAVDLNPHQIEAALFALRSPLSKGVIIADEVGLGKTIEAGILLCQFWAEQRRKLVVVCPAALRKQWALELEEKFNVPTKILDARSYPKGPEGASVLNGANAILIMSYHFTARIADDLFPIPWDLVVLDEAHKLRNAYKKDNKIGRAIKHGFAGRRKALLTATPLQNSLMELYGLTSIIDDHIFGDASSFRSQYTTSPADHDVLRGRLKNFCWRTLREDVQEYIMYTERHALTVPFTPSPREQELYDLVSTFLLRGHSHALPGAQRQLTTLVMRKLLASSSTAIAGTLETIVARLKRLKNGEKVPSNIIETLIDSDDLEGDYLEEDEAQIPSADSDDIVPESLLAEIEEVQGLADLANSIDVDAKTLELISALKAGFGRMADMGAKNKALIFTESRRTQMYLKAYLEKNGYGGQIATFSGTNADDGSKAIYERWVAENKITGRATGSRDVDIRTAIVDHFRDHADILIATEAAAEGLNLQFCSLVVNYDLPWNPQRIEQRIGRCHRYGQKHDVVVINFLNNANAADQRVYELLSEKYKLFEGVFGASDEILGTLESGVDFEKRILEIYQSCRAPEEIEIAFAALQTEMESSIQSRMAETRLKLFTHFDEDVHARLKMKLDDARVALDRTSRQFWLLSRHLLDGMSTFEDETLTFQLANSPVSNVSPGRYHMINKAEETVPSKYLYRLSHPLGEHVIEAAKALDTQPAKVIFRPDEHLAKITLVDRLRGKQGWLRLHRLKIDSFSREEYLVFTAMDRTHQPLDQETCEKLMSIPGYWAGGDKPLHDLQMDILDGFQRANLDDVIRGSEERNAEHLEEEWSRLDAWTDDKHQALRLQLKDVDAQLKELKRAARSANHATEKLKLRREIMALEKKRTEAWREHDEAARQLESEKEQHLDALEAHMKMHVETVELFTIQWEVEK